MPTTHDFRVVRVEHDRVPLGNPLLVPKAAHGACLYGHFDFSCFRGHNIRAADAESHNTWQQGGDP